MLDKGDDLRHQGLIGECGRSLQGACCPRQPVYHAKDALAGLRGSARVTNRPNCVLSLRLMLSAVNSLIINSFLVFVYWPFNGVRFN